MKRYVALLRGINISGKNKIAMAELKEGFAQLGFSEVKTYLNSENIAFSSDAEDVCVISNTIEAMIKDKFDLNVPVFIEPQEELQELLNNSPDWWGSADSEIYDNLIFLKPSLSHEEFHREMGESKAEYEKVQNYKNVVFWSFSRKNYQKTNWWSRTASSDVRDEITIRTANTIRKAAFL